MQAVAFPAGSVAPPPGQLSLGRCSGIIRRRRRVTSASEDPFVQHQDVIAKALKEVCRRYRLRQDQAEEFLSVATIRLLDDDRAILRKYAGGSSMRTFLAVVATRLFLDWSNAQWGRWRPSAEAQRQGPVAIELERLVFRDGWSVREAFEQYVAGGRASFEECERVWRLLPRSPRPTTLPLTEMTDPPAVEAPSDLLTARQEGQRVLRALERAINGLDTQDRVLVRLQYWQSCTVAEIARMHGLNQRELYRRFVGLRERLRRELEANGVDGAIIADTLGRLDPDHD